MTPELVMDDLDKLKCLPADMFDLYRNVTTGDYSSVNIVISECGGSLTDSKTITKDAPTAYQLYDLY